MKRTLQTSFVLIIAAVILGVSLTLCSCGGTRHKPAMIRTTTSHPGMMGAAASTTVTETPYESPAFTAAGQALFSRP